MRPSCSDTMANVRHMTEEEGKRSGRTPERSGLLRAPSRNILGLASMPRGSHNGRRRRGRATWIVETQRAVRAAARRSEGSVRHRRNSELLQCAHFVEADASALLGAFATYMKMIINVDKIAK